MKLSSQYKQPNQLQGLLFGIVTTCEAFTHQTWQEIEINWIFHLLHGIIW